MDIIKQYQNLPLHWGQGEILKREGEGIILKYNILTLPLYTLPNARGSAPRNTDLGNTIPGRY